jgi:ABC-type dipeptide/oligopeptide/nickel transport system permease subunit
LSDVSPRPGPRGVLKRAGVVDDPTADGDPGQEPGPLVQPEREFTVEARSQFQMVSRRFFRHRLAMGSLIVLGLMTLIAGIGGRVWKYSYTDITPDKRVGPTLDVIPWIDGDGFAFGDHPFGTETVGKDMLALTMRGMQKSLQIAFVVAALATLAGVLVGGTAGYFGGRVDRLLMRFVDLMLVIPLVAAGAVLSKRVQGGQWWLLAVILATFTWMALARIVRGEFLALREREFVEAARAVGAPDMRIIFKHMLPNVVGSVIVAATLTVAGAILVETALSYLGLGVKAPDTSLGLLVSQNQSAFKTAPWLFWFPGLAIIIIALCVNFIGDGLRDAFDPKQTRVRA